MYKEIIMKNIQTHKQITIPLKKGVNLILGPKGGGKTSLLNAIAGASINAISKTTKDIFKGSENRPLELDKIKLVSGEENNFSSMLVLSNKEAQNKFDSSMNIVGQNDAAKSNLTEAKSVEKASQEIALNEVRSNDQYTSIYNTLLELKSVFTEIKDLYQTNIYWEQVFKIIKISKKPNVFSKLNYSQKPLNNNFQSVSKELKELNEQIKSFGNLVNKFVANFEKNKLISKPYFNYVKETRKKIIEILHGFFNANVEEKKALQKKNHLANLFEKTYNKLIDELKTKNYQKHGLEVFQNKTLLHMKKMAQLLKRAKKFFFNFINKELLVESKIVQEKDLLSHKLEEDIVFDDEEKMEILKIIFYSSNTTSDIHKWIEQAINKGFKDFKRETFDSKVSFLIAKKIKVFAGDLEYVHMSPGQKSIFGIKYKLNKAEQEKHKYLFLDQPEDNLDNHTIASEMLDKIKNSQAEQIFIVTHNANIGILTNPSNVIVANLANNERPYECEKIEIIKDNPQAYYLEGGSEYLKQRYNKVMKKGEKDEN